LASIYSSVSTQRNMKMKWKMNKCKKKHFAKMTIVKVEVIKNFGFCNVWVFW